MALGPTCPHCGARVPFRRTQYGLGKVFACPGCGARLVMSRWQGFLITFPILAIYMVVRIRLSDGLVFWLWTAAMVTSVAVMAWLFMKPRPAQRDEASVN